MTTSDASGIINEEFAALEINPGRVLRAIARIGYTPASAICDIIDNAVAADAGLISIELQREPDVAESRRNSAARYIIADNGRGMSSGQLIDALGLGVVREYEAGSLGKFGLGLKSAGLSQGDRLEVITKTWGSEWIKAALDLEHVEAKRSFECQWLQVDENDLELISRHLSDTEHGTVIIVEKMHKQNHPSIKKTRSDLSIRIGVAYYYYLIERDLCIQLDGEGMSSFDPLFVSEAEISGNMDETKWDGRDVRWLERPTSIVLDAENGVEAQFEATQLVHPPAFENPAEMRKKYMIGGEHYGFFVYRNKRLIRWGERFGGIIPTDQDYFAFRGRILISDTADDAFNIDVKKSEILLSEEAESVLSESVYEARRMSRAAWRNAAKLLRAKIHTDPVSKAAEALSEVDFPDLLPSDPDDAQAETERKVREKKEATRHPLQEEEREQARRDGRRVTLVDHLDDNALWQRAHDATLGTVVRINRSHRFMRMFEEKFGNDADVTLLLHALFLSLAVGESRSVRNIQDVTDEILEEVFTRYREMTSAAIYKATADALEERLV
ncbi:ATP-binding protein [Streptosporangium minutum]|uniref:ATP-binding protein n=1 Tax=Streptosporangium minutum TaxID=569862 RepID=A0A243RV79_9ACTN|nr:ATP-binding protein [Streptosporangium minutum]OUC98919.1 hypothetical protein CA984_05265 [Streptosporangium minutum]